MVSKMNWKIWGTKVLKSFVLVLIAGLGSVYGNSPYYLALVPVFVAIENYWKHKN